jgi:hypothetical protein
MKKAISVFAVMVVLGITFSFIGATSVSATRAVTHKGNGCYVRVGTGGSDYLEDVSCTATDILKMDDDGNFEFYVYQDHGQLPEGGWRPTQAYRNTFEQCFQFSFGVVCGTVKETVTPSGEYKSSFKSN